MSHGLNRAKRRYIPLHPSDMARGLGCIWAEGNPKLGNPAKSPLMTAPQPAVWSGSAGDGGTAGGAGHAGGRGGGG